MRDDVAAEGVALEHMTPIPMGADMKHIERLALLAGLGLIGLIARRRGKPMFA